MTLVIELLLVLAVLAAIGYPVLKKVPLAAEGVDEGDQAHKLASAKEAAFVAIKDLEFDFKTGKMDEEDYQNLKSKYESEAAAILRRIDHLQAEGTAPKAVRVGGKARFCSACGAKTDPDDRFCSSCGKPVKQA